MKFDNIAKTVENIPYTQKERGHILFNYILKYQPQHCLELGFAHGVASCYIAAALEENQSGTLTTVDLLSSKNLQPNIEELLAKANLLSYVDIHREKNSYTWFLKKEIEKNTLNYSCSPKYDLCFIDGPKNWTIDGCSFFLVDKLLNENGYIIFDDYNWTYDEYSKSEIDGLSIREMSDDQIQSPNIQLIFQLLVMQHPNYSNFVIDDDWAWAQKVRSGTKTLRIESTQSFKYKLIKKMRSLKR